jgi:amino acid permease
MASKEFSNEKPESKVSDSRNDFDAESVISNGGPREDGKLVRQLKNRHIAMIRFVH